MEKTKAYNKHKSKMFLFIALCINFIIKLSNPRNISIHSYLSFDLNENESIENYQPQASELLTESDFRSDNDDENSTNK